MKKTVRIICTAIVFILTIAIEGTGAKAASVPNSANLLNTYGNVFDKVGNALADTEILDDDILNIAKREYNSITAARGMTPEDILGKSPKLISINEAKSLGYYIPNNYREGRVPRLNFETMDKLLKACYDKKLRMRGHTLISHIETPDWFFRINPNDPNSAYVDKDMMDKRMEFYIKSVINHVASNKNGIVINEWDVVDDFMMFDSCSKFGWQKVYGENLNVRAEFIKKAFEYAFNALLKRGLAEKVKLFYNDAIYKYNVNKVIGLINYINYSRKICTGVGIQSHLTVKSPIEDYVYTLKELSKRKLEIQITELDVMPIDNADQAKYYHDLILAILRQKREGANITELRWWGLSDDVSWRKEYLREKKYFICLGNELLYSDYNTKKPAYDAVLQAYFDAGFTTVKTPELDPIFITKPEPKPEPEPEPEQWPYPTATIADGWYYIKNVHANKYITVKDDLGKSGQNVELIQGLGINGQKWHLTNLGNGYITLKSKLGSFMLDVANNEDKDLANIQISDENSGDSQQFQLKAKYNTKKPYLGVVITTKTSNNTKVLDDYNSGTTNGSNVEQFSFLGENNQLWIFEPTVV